MIIEIKYRDKQNWLSVTGKATNWTNYSKKYKNERVRPYFIAPEIVADTWDGLDHEIQHVIWDSYTFEFYIKESEIQSVNQMKSCSDIQILEYSQNNSGTILNKTYILDIQKSDYLNISEPESVGQTSASKVTITFRTNRTIINKSLPVLNTNSLQIGDASILNLNSSSILDLDFTPSDLFKIFTFSSDKLIVSSEAGLQMFELVNSEWIQLGNNFNPGYLSLSECAIINSTQIAVFDTSNQLRCLAWDGTDFAQVGNTFASLGIEANPSISYLLADTIALCSDTGDYIRAYYFDGTDFAQVGNTYATGSISSPKIAFISLPSPSIVYTNRTVNQAIVLEWDGTDFTLASSTTDLVLSTSYAIAANSGYLYLLSNDYLSIYLLSGSTFVLKDRKKTKIGTYPKIAINAYATIPLGLTLNNYIYSELKKYSDFDILEYSKDVEPVNVPWYDGSIRTLQKVNKKGYQILLYILSENIDEFISNYKYVSAYKINGVTVAEPEIEIVQIAIGLFKVVFKGIYTTIINDFDASPNDTYNLKIVSGITTYDFYTDYPPFLVSEAPNISTYSNENGVQTASKAISKIVKQVKFYLNESDSFNLKILFETLTTVTLDTVPVLEKREVTPTLIGVDLYEVIVNCLISATATP